jgi:hypothetical protein
MVARMSLTPQELAARIKVEITRMEKRKKLKPGQLAFAYVEEQKDTEATEKPVTRWIEQVAQKIKAEDAARDRLMSPVGLRSMFVGLQK